MDGQGIVEAVGDDQGELDAVVVDGFLDLAFIGQFDFLEAFSRANRWARAKRIVLAEHGVVERGVLALLEHGRGQVAEAR
ncbi:hypothetical protein LP420_13760 [Massilia sp. B-10]|nr:hypothetical protein LP420_13760 [Massilia sp. B-10]